MRYNNSNILVTFGILFILSTLSPLTGVELFSKVTIGIEIFFMVWCFAMYRRKNISQSEFSFGLTITILFFLHFLINPASDKETFIKILCPIIFFFAGKKVPLNNFTLGTKKKVFILLSICVLPFLIRILQLIISIPSPRYYSIFVNSNNFSYYFIVCSIIVYFSFKNRRVFFLYLAAGFALSKTIGALVGLAGGYAISARKSIYKPKFVVGGIFVAVLLYFLIFNSGLEIFERVKNTYLTFNAITKSNSSLKDLNNIEYGDAINYATSGQNDLSFLFRIKNWTQIVNAYFDSDIENLILGHGLMSVPKVTSTGLVAHNDYLGILYELGLALTLVLVIGYWKILVQLKAKELNFIFYSIAIYHFTENLYYNFLITSLHFYLLGIYSNNQMKANRESSPNKQISLHQGWVR